MHTYIHTYLQSPNPAISNSEITLNFVSFALYLLHLLQFRLIHIVHLQKILWKGMNEEQIESPLNYTASCLNLLIPVLAISEEPTILKAVDFYKCKLNNSTCLLKFFQC